jgi:tetratricopeptide (TPR) repeat protein
VRGQFESAVALDPDNVEARLDLVQYYLVAPGLMGGSRDKAKAQVAEIAKRSAFKGHLAAAGVAEDAHDFGGAEREYRSAIADFPDSAAVAAYALGLMYQRAKQYDSAFATFEQLARDHPEATNALYALGRLGALTGQRLDRAEEALKLYLAQPLREGNPPPASAHYRLGTVYERTGRKELARQEYEASLKLENRPEVREALERVGRP